MDAMPSSADVVFGDLLRRHRQAAGLTQEELAARSGLSVRGLSDLERGVHAIPRKDTVLLLVEALGEGRGIASLLAAYAAVAVEVGEHQRALRLLGAAEAVRETAGHTVLLHQVRHAQTLAAVREAVGETAFATGFAVGRALQLDEAVTEARAVGKEARLQPA